MNDTTRDEARPHPQGRAGQPAEAPDAPGAPGTGMPAGGTHPVGVHSAGPHATGACAAGADTAGGPPGPGEMLRFRLAALRARLALLGVAFDPDTDESTLRRMLRAAEHAGDGHATAPAPPDEATPPPSEVLRRETARHLRQRQREAAQDAARGEDHASAGQSPRQSAGQTTGRVSGRTDGTRGESAAPRPARRRERGKA